MNGTKAERLNYIVAVVFVALCLAGCESDRAGTQGHEIVDIRHSPISTQPSARVIEPAVWDTVFLIGGAEDTTFYHASLIVADEAGPYVYDYGRSQLLRFSRSGELLWAFGGRGRGPDEFMSVRDIDIDPTGRLWILDPDNARVTVLTADGQVAERISFGELPRPEQLVPLGDHRVMLFGLERERPLYVIDRSGKVVDRLAMPWPNFRKLDPMAAQMFSAADRAGEYFALAFRIGDGFFVFKGGVPLRYHGVFVEHTEFPSVSYFQSDDISETMVAPAPASAASLAIAEDRLFVHFAGTTDDAYELVDVYQLETGEYERTLKLPDWVGALAVSDGMFYGKYDDPYPTLVAWRLVDRSTLAR